MEKEKAYDKEFKISAVKLITEQGKKGVDVARELGVDAKRLYAWKHDYLHQGAKAFVGTGQLTPGNEENHKLKKELVQVAMERDILKKALAVFSRLQR